MIESKLSRMLLSGALLTILAGCSGGKKDDSEGKKASSPEEAVKNLLEAAQAGDKEAVRSQFAAPFRKMMEAQDSGSAARKDWKAALDEKFGKAKNAFPDRDEIEDMKRLKNLEVEKKESRGEDKVELTIKMTRKNKDGKEESRTQKMLAIKEGDAWKLCPDKMPTDEELKKGLERITKTKEVYAKLTPEVKSGKFKSRAEAEKAYFDEMYPRKSVAPNK